MKRIGCLLLLLAFCLIPFTAISVSGESDLCTPLSSFQHVVDSENRTVTLSKYIGTSTQVTVPGSYAIDGISYQVILDCRTVFAQNKSIVSVLLSGNIRPANNSCAGLFAGCSQLKKADVSGLDTVGVVDMSGLFSGCTRLSDLTGYENWDTGSVQSIYMAFNQTRSLKTVDLRGWDLSGVLNSGWCFQYCGAIKIYLPDSLKTISAGFMNHASQYADSTFSLPASVQQIGYAHTFYDFGTGYFNAFSVPEENTHFSAIDGILYSSDGSELLAIPKGKVFPNGEFQIPEGVTFLGELSFSRNHNISTLILPDSFIIYSVEENDPEYILFMDNGNLNGGSNLNIAIYRFTDITSYAVKDTNPRYSSRDGIIYTKDMTAVVSIPSRYDRLINIPEGVTTWVADTVWISEDNEVLGSCPGVYIPATLSDINEVQLSQLNYLKSASSSFTISVHPENPAYCLDENGLLVAHSFTDYILDSETSSQTALCDRGCGVSHTIVPPPEPPPETIPPETAPLETEPDTTPIPTETIAEETVSPVPEESSHLWYIPASVNALVIILCAIYFTMEKKKK